MDLRRAYPSAFAALEGVAAPEWGLGLEVREVAPLTTLIYVLFSIGMNLSSENLILARIVYIRLCINYY